MNIKISKQITNILPSFKILAFKMNIEIKKSNDLIFKKADFYINKYQSFKMEDVLKIPRIKEGRDSYKLLRKDPSRYRLACESLIRRLVKKRGLYYINNAVDIGNLLSIELNRSTAILDYDKIKGDVLIRIGTKEDDYEGIGRGKIDVSNIPVYVDDISPFGSTTSDTLRTAITNETRKILVFVICFNDTFINESINKTEEMFKELGNVSEIERMKVNYE